MKKFLMALIAAAAVSTAAPVISSPARADVISPCYGYFNCNRPPAGATYRCRDGSWSAVQDARYACVGHYGVWYAV